MKKSKPDSDGNIATLETFHYNVKYVTGVLFTRVRNYHFFGQRPSYIEWIWIVEEKRQATRQEIARLCAGKS